MNRETDRILVTAIILTLNEEQNISRCLEYLARIDDIATVDSLAQARAGCKVAIFCVEKDNEPPVLPDPGLVESRCFRRTLRLNNPGISMELARALRHEVLDFDIVHVHAIWNFPSWWAMRAAYNSRVPYVVAPQGSLTLGH